MVSHEMGTPSAWAGVWVTCNSWTKSGDTMLYVVFSILSSEAALSVIVCANSVSVLEQKWKKKKKKKKASKKFRRCVSSCPQSIPWDDGHKSFFLFSFCLGEEHALSALEGYDCPHCEHFSISSAPASPSFGAAWQAWDGHCSLSFSVYTLRRPRSGFGSSLCNLDLSLLRSYMSRAECTGEMSSNDDCNDGKKHLLKLNPFRVPSEFLQLLFYAIMQLLSFMLLRQ